MKKIFLFIAFMSVIVSAQTFTVTQPALTKTDTLGAEVIFDIHVKNTGSSSLPLTIIREENNLPGDWSSSLCFTSCFAPSVDTIKTTFDFGARPIKPGATVKISLHVFPMTNHGKGTVKLKILNPDAPSNVKTFTFEIKTRVVGIHTDSQIPGTYYLSQNYPNPFNPSTKIKFRLQKEENVEIEVFNILGQKVDVLINETLSPGTHTVDFNANNLPSGVYFYKMKTDKFVKIRKMILEK